MFNFLQGILQKLGSSFIVACFVPAMSFVTISLISFSPFFPIEFAELIKDFARLTPIIFIALIFTTILAFVLYSLSTYIYKAYEGFSTVHFEVKDQS